MPGRKFCTNTSARAIKLAHDRHRFRPLQVERQRPLASVCRDEQRGEFARAADRLPAAAGDVAADRLDLDHLGALVRKEHRRQRPRDDAGQIEHPDSRQRSRHHRTSSSFMTPYIQGSSGGNGDLGTGRLADYNERRRSGVFALIAKRGIMVLFRNLSGVATMTGAEKNGVALLVGAGDAIGAAVARRFAAGGYQVCVARRDAEKSTRRAGDRGRRRRRARRRHRCRSEEARYRRCSPESRHNSGRSRSACSMPAPIRRKPCSRPTPSCSLQVWELACYAGFLTGREAARYMLKRGHGTILFTGATASCAAAPVLPPLRRRSSACGRSRSRWRASCAEEHPCRASRHRRRGRQRGDPRAAEGRKRRSTPAKSRRTA